MTTDDLAPSNLEGQFEYWDKLKKKHNDFKLLAFTTADWQFTRINRDFKNNLITNKEFIDFCNERSDWLSIAYHGFQHTISMASQSFETQEVIIDKMLTIFKKFKKKFEGNFVNAYKPPFYRWNTDTLQICMDREIDYLFIQSGILTPKVYLFQSRQGIGLIDSHTNPECPMPDRIDLVYEDFDELLSSQRGIQNFLLEVPK